MVLRIGSVSLGKQVPLADQVLEELAPVLTGAALDFRRAAVVVAVAQEWPTRISLLEISTELDKCPRL
jgi:hypothetical protein